MGDRVARMRTDRHFQRRTCLVVLLLLSVKDGKVVVGFGEFGKVFGQPGENSNGVSLPPGFSEDQTFQKTPLCIARSGGNQLFRLVHRLGHLSLFHQTLDFVDRRIVRWWGALGAGTGHGQAEHKTGENG